MSTDTVPALVPTIHVQREARRASVTIAAEWEAVKKIPDLAERTKEQRRIQREYGSRMREAFVLEGPGGVPIKVNRSTAMFLSDIREAKLEA